MNRLSFFIPAYYPQNYQKSLTQSVGEWVDSYLYLGGKVAFVLTEQKMNGSFPVELKDGPALSDTICSSALKIASYIIIVLPLIALCTRIVVRSLYSFHLPTNETPTLHERFEPPFATPTHNNGEKISPISKGLSPTHMDIHSPISGVLNFDGE